MDEQKAGIDQVVDKGLEVLIQLTSLKERGLLDPATERFILDELRKLMNDVTLRVPRPTRNHED